MVLNDEDVLSIELEYRLKRAITCDRWIALKFLQGFLESVFLGVGMERLLGDEDVWSVELKFRTKRAITVDTTVGSHSNF